MDGYLSCYKFDYVWRNISLDLILTDKDVDNTVDVDNDGWFEPETEAEEVIFKKIDDKEDNNKNDAVNDDDKVDDDDNKIKKDEEQNDYYDDKEPAAEEEIDNEMGNNNNDSEIYDKTINEQNDDEKIKQEKRYYKAKYILDWVNKFSKRYYIHPGFAMSIDKMMKLFKGCSKMTHRMKQKPIKNDSIYMQWIISWVDIVSFSFLTSSKKRKREA